jgi:hypothetical protein
MTESTAIIVGALLGGVIGVAGTYFGAIKLSNRERRIKSFNDAADNLRYALIKTQQRLEIKNGDRGVVREDFIIHAELKRRFELCLPDSGFTEAWEKYKYWYDNIARQGTEDKLFPEMNPLKDDPMFQQALKAKPYDLIQNIIKNAKHK